MIVVPARSAELAVGTVFIAPIPMDGIWKGNHTGATMESVFTIQIDNLPPVQVTTNSTGVFTNLALGQKHMVKIRLDGKPRESFPLKFETFQGDSSDKNVHIRLRYDPMYGYWHRRAVDKFPCNCQKQGRR